MAGRPRKMYPPLTADQQKLVADWLELWCPVRLLRKTFAGTFAAAEMVGMEPEDMRQAGLVGVCEAARRFQAGRGLKFSTYAAMWIRACVQQAIDDVRGYSHKTDKQRPKFVRGDEWVEGQRGDVAPTWDMIEDARERGVDHADARLDAGTLLATLDDRQRRILLARFGVGGPKQSFRALAESRGVSKARIQQIEKKAMDELRELTGAST